MFKESSSSENFSSILQTLNDPALNVESELLVEVLEGVAQSKSLDMILMLLPQEDTDILNKLFGRLTVEISATQSSILSDLKQKYNVKN